MQLSVIIPAFNEAERLGATLAAVREYLARQPAPAEIIVVDDGSRDETAAIADRGATGPAPGPRSRPIPIRCLRLPENRGKGHALRTGIAAAAGRLLLLCDADLSTPIDMLARLETALAAGADLAIGSRDLPGSRLAPPQPPLRRLLAAAFRGLRRCWLLPDIRDTQCGFKLLRRATVGPLAAACREDGWLFDLELLTLAQAAGLTIREVAVDWSDRRPSRVRPLTEVLPALRGLVRIRRRRTEPLLPL